MTWLLSLISGPGGLYALLMAAIGAALVWYRRTIINTERNKQRAKDADSYEQSLKDLADAAAARARVDPRKLPDDDPYRRD